MNKNIIFFLLTFTVLSSSAQYSSFKLEKKKDKDKKEVKAPDAIETKTKGCEKFEGLFNIYQDKKSGKSYLDVIQIFRGIASKSQSELIFAIPAYK